MSRKRSFLEACPTSSYLPNDIDNPAPHTTQWWYYKMKKTQNEAHIGHVDTKLTYNPSQGRVVLAYTVYTRSSPNFCHPSVKDVE